MRVISRRVSSGASSRAERSTGREVEVRLEGHQQIDGLVVERPALPAPQHGAQLVLVAERHAVVDALHESVRTRQQVTALAVGVVDDGVQHDHALEVRVLGTNEQTEVHRLVDVDPQLAHARSEGSVPHDGRWHESPAGRLGDDVRRDLASRQRSLGEVPQRPLPRDRLVHAHRGDTVEGRHTEQRGVARVDQPPLDVELADASAGGARRRRTGPAARAGRSWLPARRSPSRIQPRRQARRR